MSASSPTPPVAEEPVQTLRTIPLLVASLAGMGLASHLAADSLRMAALLVLGSLLGVTLYHSSFGFTAAYRRLILHGEVRGIRAQLVMLAAATLLFAPVLAAGEIFGQPVSGAVAPVGVSMFFGAFLFGIGMQLGGGCGSGTLYAVGGGSPRMLLVLTAFCGGGFWASLHMGAWQSLPEWEPQALGERFGWTVTALVQAGGLAGAAWALRRYDHAPQPAEFRLLRGPWPLMAGALLLALFNLVTVLLAGHPWNITWAFTLWGAKALQAVGWDPAGAPFWNAPFQRAALENSVLSDVTSVMNIGLILGAAGAAALAGRFSSVWRIPARSLAAAVLGGLAMGYGARLSYGCNIGAFFSGVASTSLHGWVWIIAALIGSWLGVRWRPVFGLVNEPASRPTETIESGAALRLR